VEVLIPLVLGGAFIVVVIYSVALQKRATLKQDTAIGAQAEAMEMVKKSLELQERSLSIATQALEELRQLNAKLGARQGPPVA